jgi:microcystin-dependent protein
MGQPFIGEIRVVGFNFAPVNWALCNGQTLSISGNEALFSLIGTTYGGDGATTFNLPNLCGRVPIHQGTGFILGQGAGTESVTLTVDNMADHSHVIRTSKTATSISPVGHYPAVGTNNVFAASTATTKFESAAIGPAGGGLPHENRQAFLTVNFIISLLGIYPAQT